MWAKGGALVEVEMIQDEYSISKAGLPFKSRKLGTGFLGIELLGVYVLEPDTCIALSNDSRVYLNMESEMLAHFACDKKTER